MGSPTNLTDRIGALRNRPAPEPSPPKPAKTRPARSRPATAKPDGERAVAVDYFLIFVVALTGLTVVAQLFLIVWLDLF